MSMKKLLFPTLIVVLTACEPVPYVPPPARVVDETYVHTYGMQVDPQDWTQRGQNGQVITTLQSGVTVSKNYCFGQQEGETTYSYPYSSAIQKKELHKGGQVVEETEHYMSGAPHKKTERLGNATKTTTWYESGSPRAIEEISDNGLLLKGDYMTPDNKVESHVADKNGTRTLRDAAGTLTAKETVVNGLVAERTNYYSNGSVKDVIPYLNGRIHGIRKSFLSTGEPLEIQQWVNGNQDGLTTTFQNGVKFAEVPYIQGEKHGIEKRYVDGKVLFQEVTWEYGHQMGLKNYSKSTQAA